MASADSKHLYSANHIYPENVMLHIPDRSFACNFTRAKFLHAKRGIIFYTTKMWCKKLHF